MLFPLLFHLNIRNDGIMVGYKNAVHAVIVLSVGQGLVAFHIGEDVVYFAFYKN